MKKLLFLIMLVCSVVSFGFGVEVVTGKGYDDFGNVIEDKLLGIRATSLVIPDNGVMLLPDGNEFAFVIAVDNRLTQFEELDYELKDSIQVLSGEEVVEKSFIEVYNVTDGKTPHTNHLSYIWSNDIIAKEKLVSSFKKHDVVDMIVIIGKTKFKINTMAVGNFTEKYNTLIQ